MKSDHFAIWITVENENPDIEDIVKAKEELYKMHLLYEGKIGIGFTRVQWGNFLRNMSRYEERFATGVPAMVMGLPVRMIEEKVN